MTNIEDLVYTDISMHPMLQRILFGLEYMIAHATTEDLSVRKHSIFQGPELSVHVSKKQFDQDIWTIISAEAHLVFLDGYLIEEYTTKIKGKEHTNRMHKRTPLRFNKIKVQKAKYKKKKK